MSTRTIKVDYLARVEGEGALFVKVENDRVIDVQFKVFEPPRFFEAFLRGRSFAEAPDITSRICGICPIAYQMSATHALEDAFGVHVDGQLRELRRLIYCGEWIESHALHIFMLHAPDFLGYHDAIEMAKEHATIVQRGLQIKKIGNEIVRVVAGREIHPINVRVGGFYRVPTKRELAVLTDQLKWGQEAALKSLRWVSEFPFPDFKQDYEFVALRHAHEYPLNEGRLVSTHGLDITCHEYENHFVEEHVARSNALHSILKKRGSYFVGPMARFNLNHDRLPSDILTEARDAGLMPACVNPFKSILVRCVEVLYAFVEALRIIQDYVPPDLPVVDFTPKAGTGHSCTEAPRGMLYHRYQLDSQGIIKDANIVPPTSQNQTTIESDLRRFVENRLDLPEGELKWRCEQAIRNYDPCISCATHALRIDLQRD